jgi:CRP-like cAMP-binding protein
MTQDLIANMLGVRREGVNEAANKLQQAGLISHIRGRITVLDRNANAYEDDVYKPAPW